MSSVRPKISSLPLTFVLICIWGKKGISTAYTLRKQNRKMIGMIWFAWGWLASKKWEFLLVQPFWRAQMGQNKKDPLWAIANTYMKIILSCACCHPWAHAYSAFAATRSFFYSQVMQVIDLLLMKW